MRIRKLAKISLGTRRLMRFFGVIISESDLSEKKAPVKKVLAGREKVIHQRLGLGSVNNSVGTPKKLYNLLDKEFDFDFDPCPLGGFEDGSDGLKIDWGTSNFINPPYSEIPKWIEKGLNEVKDSKKTCVYLITARTHSCYWQRMVFPYASEIRFIQKSVKFEGYNKGFNFPLAIIVYKGPLKRNMPESSLYQDTEYPMISFHWKKEKGNVINV